MVLGIGLLSACISGNECVGPENQCDKHFNIFCRQLALSAACPIQRGYLVDTDCRWDIISASVDCRTREERGLVVRLADIGL